MQIVLAIISIVYHFLIVKKTEKNSTLF